MQNYARIGGILSIVAGGIAIFSMLMLVVLAVFMAVMPGFMSEYDSSFDSEGRIVFFVIALIYGVMGIGGILVGVLAIVGGVLALKKKHWGWALAGAIAGALMFSPCGIAAVIFVSLGKNEFAVTAPAVPFEPVPRLVD